MLIRTIFCSVVVFIASLTIVFAGERGDFTDDGEYAGGPEVTIEDVIVLFVWSQYAGMGMTPTAEQLKAQLKTAYPPYVDDGNLPVLPNESNSEERGDFTDDGEYAGGPEVTIEDVIVLFVWSQYAGMGMTPTAEQLKAQLKTAYPPYVDDENLPVLPNQEWGTAVDTETATETSTAEDTGTDTGTGTEDTATETSTGTATEGLGCEVPASVEIATDKTVSFNPPYPGAKWQSSVSNLDLTDSVLSWDAAVATDSEATIKYSVFECNTSGGSFVATDSMTLTETTMSSAYESKAYMVLSYQVVDTIETADEESGRCVEIATDDKRCYSDPEYYNN